MTQNSMPCRYLPQSGWIFGQANLAREAGYRSPHYFLKKIQKDPTAKFIVAVGVDFDTSVNSIPPGQDVVVFTIPASLHAWGDATKSKQAEGRNISALIRWEKFPLDVSSCSVR